MYTGAFTGTTGQHYYLVRTDITDINEPVSIERYIGTYVIGLTTDIDTGLIYTTTYNNHIEVYNTATFPNENPSDTETEGISSPGDIIVRGDVSYKPPFPSLTHLLHLQIARCLLARSYKICFRIVSRFYPLRSNC